MIKTQHLSMKIINKEIKKHLTALCFLLGFISLQGQSADSLAHSLADKAQKINNIGSFPFLQDAFDLCEKYGCADSTMARLYQRKSVATFYGLSNYDLALSYTDTAIHFHELAHGKKHIITVNSYYNKGVIQSFIGRYFQAKHTIESAISFLNTLEKFEKKDSVSLTWNFELMRINQRLGDFNTAEILCNSILKDKLLSPLIEKWTKANLGLIFMYQARFNDAKFLYLNYLKDPRFSLDPVINGNLGLTFLALDEVQLAESLLLEANKVYLEIFYLVDSKNNKVDLSNSHANLLQLYLQKKEYGQADYHYSEALRLLLEVDSTGRLPRDSAP